MGGADTTENRGLLGMVVGGLGSMLAAGLLVSVRDRVDPVNVALILVVLVLLGAVIGGRGAGVASVLAAALSFDFFYTRPYNSLKIADAADIETTILLMVVGIAAGEIALRAHRLRAAVGAHRRQLGRVHRIAKMAASGEPVDDMISAVAAEMIETLHLRDCYFERPPFLASLSTIEPTGSVRSEVYRYTRDGFELPREGVELSVMSRDETLGRFVLIPSHGVPVSLDERMTAVALADQLGVVLGRSSA